MKTTEIIRIIIGLTAIVVVNNFRDIAALVSDLEY